MTTFEIDQPRAIAVNPAGILAEFFRREPVFAGMALFLVMAMAPTIAAMALDTRQFNGVNVWEKPFKFELALAVYLGTLAWFAGWLPQGMTARRSYRGFALVVCAAITLEMIWVGGAAANATASHFNVSNPVMGAIYGLMGLLALTLTSASLVYGVAFLRDRSGRLDPALRLSLGLGLILTFVLTVVVAGYMSSQGGHWVGGNQSDAEALPLMGWARDGGDLRVAHFLATHAMHFIPAAGFAASRSLGPGAARLAVYAAALAFTALVAFAFLQALAGQPFPGFL